MKSVWIYSLWGRLVGKGNRKLLMRTIACDIFVLLQPQVTIALVNIKREDLLAAIIPE
jgi:hypothetical protein